MTCEQAGCKNNAVSRMYWPNNPPKLICEEHKEKAKSISKAMGFYLHFEDTQENEL